jgi:hypothetical protein
MYLDACSVFARRKRLTMEDKTTGAATRSKPDDRRRPVPILNGK